MESDIRTKARNGHGMLTKTNCFAFCFCLTASKILESRWLTMQTSRRPPTDSGF